MKKLLYLSDLYNFYVSQNKNVKFSSKDADTTIVVHIDEPFTYSVNEDDDLNLYCPIRLCHTEQNINQSFISETAMKDAIETAYEMPILGYIYDNDGELTFAGHEFYINEDLEIVYEEVPVGVVSSKQKLELVYDEEYNKTYLDGLGKIWRTYSKAAEILERDQKFSVSVELTVDELSYDSKNKVLCIDKFRFSGVTILGKDRETGKEIKPGMVGSNISLTDFSEKNNSVFSQNEKMIELLSRLNDKLDGFNNKEFLRKEDAQMKKNFEEEAETSEGKVEEATDDTPDVNEANFDEAPKKKKKAEDDDPVGVEDDEEEETPKQEETPTQVETPTQEETPQQEEPAQTEEPTQPEETEQQQEDNGEEENPEDVNYYSVDYAVTVNGEKREFSTIRNQLLALTTLCNDMYGEADGCWYECDADAEAKVVYMHDYWNDKHYRQAYTVKKDVFSLKGERTEVFCTYLSLDEQKQLEQMKSNYSATVEKLAQYETEPEKLEVLASADYEQIKDTDVYKELAKRDTYFSMSKDELVEKLDACLLEFAKSHKIEFSANESENKSVGMKLFGNPTKKTTTGTSRYGGLFSK